MRFLFSFFFFIFLHTSIYAEDLRLAAESEPTLTVADCVNVMSGDFFCADRDLVVDGPTPLSYTRYYDSGDNNRDFFFFNHYGYGVSLGYPLVLKDHEENIHKLWIAIDQRHRFAIPFKIKIKKGIARGCFDKKIFKSGYTNSTEALLRGEPSLSHTEVILDTDETSQKCAWNVHFANGSKRVYLGAGLDCAPYVSRNVIVREDHPNGLSTHYTYDRLLRPSRISLQNSLGDELSFIHINHWGKQDYTVSASNGLSTSYHTEYKTGEIKHGGSKRKISQFFLTKIDAEHLASTENEFPVGNQINTLLKFSKIKMPNGRYVEVKYDSKSRVQALLTPLGKPFYSFEYKKKCTHVTHALGRIDTYYFSDKRLQRREEGGVRSYVYDWDDEGQLLSKSLLDKENNTLEAVHFQYNESGNIIEKKECGNITGEEKPFIVKKGTIIKSCDERVRSYLYGEKCRLLEEKDPKGVITRYQYKEGTNLVTAKFIVEADKIEQRHFYSYDHNAILIEAIEDDGCSEDCHDLSNVTYRLITRITPQMDKALFGFTKPKVKEKLYLDLTTGEEQLLKRTEMDYVKGDLLAEKRVYDAENTFAYSESHLYDERFLIKEKKDRLGRVTHFAHDENRNLIFEELHGSGKQLYKSYDTSDRLIEEKEVHEDGTILVTVHSYDLAGNKISTTDPQGFTKQWVYDFFNRCVQEIDPYGHSVYTTYDIQNNPIIVTDQDGYTTQTSYNINHQPLKISYPDCNIEKFNYFVDGSLKTKWEKDGTHVSYTYDHLGRVLSETRWNQEKVVSTKTNVYKGKNLISAIDERGIATHYAYDSAGRCISKTRAGINETYGYDALGRLSTTTKGERILVQILDPLKRIIEERTEDLFGNVYRKSTTTYDLYGNASIQRVFFEADRFIETCTLYNSFNLPYLKIDGEGNQTQLFYTHNPFTRTTIDPLGQTTLETFDAFKRVTFVEIPKLSKQEIEYSPKGNKIRQIDSIFYEGKETGSSIIAWEYDPLNNLLSLTEQDLKKTSHTYLNGRLHTTTKPDEVVLFHIYDAAGRLAEQSSSDGKLLVRYSYDLAGNLLCAQDEINKTKVVRTYDAHNQILSETTHTTLHYSYDELGRLIKIILPDSEISYQYNAADLISVSRTDATHDYVYDLAGRIIQETTFDKVPITYSYNQNHQVTQITSPFYNQQLFYDAAQNLIFSKIDENSIAYAYDGLYQLVNENTTTYAYDSIHNRLSKDGLSYEHNILHQVLSDAEHAYTYDANGNRLTKNETKYCYDPLNHLTSAGDIYYTYDALGRLSSRTSPTSQEQFLYYKEIELGSLENLKIVGKGVIAMVQNNSLYTTLRDHRGSLAVILKDHAPIATYRYNAFGETVRTGTFNSPWQFCGLRYDVDVQLIHAAKRVYDPFIGRWLTPDPLGFADGPNLYAYVHNNPMTHIDPTGLYSNFLSSAGSMFSGFTRGFVDDFTWSASELALGTYEAPNSYANMAYYAGMGTSLAIGLFNGSTEAKLAKNAACYGVKKFTQWGQKVAGKQAVKEFESLAIKTARKTHQLVFQGAKQVESQIVRNTFTVGKYRYANGAGKHYMDRINSGKNMGLLERPYMRSELTINEIMATGDPLPDPRAAAGAISWNVPGNVAGRQGNWELVIHPETDTIYHFHFK